jgi:hypothetical protein
MVDITLTTAFDTVPSDARDGIVRVLRDAMAQVAQEEGTFTRARAVFTESDEQCVFTVELDGDRKATGPLRLDLELLEDAVADPGRQALLREELREHVRRTLAPRAR